MNEAREFTTSDRHAAGATEQLWIDGCGGFRLATGTSWSLGGPSASKDESATIQIQADLPRMAGRILRNDSDYFWMPAKNRGAESSSADSNQAPTHQEKVWLDVDRPLPLPGSAKLDLSVPSPLSASAVLTLRRPHRFAGHIDAVILVADTVLIGPGKHCHLRCDDLFRRVALSHRENGWYLIRRDRDDLLLIPGQRVVVDEISLTLSKGSW